ncbi:ankyrin repeat domain-containing protein 35 isoform X3 [Pleurodeles waltl]|uniref:ankyrin repeat domain-containing protein 35 isoform X3 n=1 Tax=Pleurodeles waltl TaxID=8319 RepID=UPI0037097EB0
MKKWQSLFQKTGSRSSLRLSQIEKWNKHDQKLFEAVEKRDLGKIEALLSKKPVRASKPNPKGQSAFHLAAAKGFTECLNALLSQGVEINAKNDQGCTALHLAASGCHPDCVKLLLQHGANEESIDFHSRTALHCAASSGCVSSVLLLCDQDEISLDAVEDDGRTPLMIAAQRNHPTICSLLLERGALVNIIDKEKKTALILASEKGNIQAAETILAHGADVTAADNLGLNALHYANISRDEALKKLLQASLDKRKRGNESDDLSLSQESIDVQAETRDPFVLQNNTRYDHLAQQQDEWRRRFEEEQKKVTQLQGELLKKSHEHEVFAEGCRTEKDRFKARVLEISAVLQGKTSDLAAKRKEESRPLSQGFDQLHFLDLLAGQVQAIKEKHEQTETEKQLLQEESLSMVRRETLETNLQELEKRHQAEIERLQDQVNASSEEKANALRRVVEIEGHLDNMRSVLSQFESRKRVQSSMMEDLNEHVFEITSENERLKGLVKTLEERLEAEEKMAIQERALANKCKNAQNVLNSTIREVRQLLFQTTMEGANIQKGKQAISVESKYRRMELGDLLQNNVHQGLEPSQALDRCEQSWKKTVRSLENMLTNLEKNNRGLLDSPTQLQKATAPLNNEGYLGKYEEKVFLNGSTSTHQGEVLLSQGKTPQQEKASADGYQVLDSTNRHLDFLVGKNCLEAQEAFSRVVELEKEVSVLTLENAGLLKELNDAGEEKVKLEEELKAVRKSLLTEYVPLKDVQGKVGELEQNFLLLMDELSTEQERTKKLKMQLDSQISEMQQLKDSFPPEIIKEEKNKDVKIFSTDVLEELFWNVGTLVRKHSEAQQKVLKLEQENSNLQHDQTQFISIAEHNEKLTSLTLKIDQQAAEIAEFQKKLSSAVKAAEDLSAITHKIAEQAAEIEGLQQKLSDAIGIIEDLTSMTDRINSQAAEIEELEKKLSSATKTVEDVALMQNKMDQQVLEIQELKYKLSRANKTVEGFSAMTQKVETQATLIRELEKKISSAAKAVEELTSTNQKIESQAIEIQEFKIKLASASKAVEDLSSLMHQNESQTTEIQELKEKLFSATKAAEDLTSKTQRMDEQTLEIQDLKNKLLNATKAIQDFNSMNVKIETQTTQILELEFKLSNALRTAEELASMANKVDAQATENEALRHRLSMANKEVEYLHKELLSKNTNSVSKDEHIQIVSAYEKRLTSAKGELESDKVMLADMYQEVTILKQKLDQASIEAQELKFREESYLQNHEEVKSSLEFQIQSLKEELKVMLDKLNKACAQASSWENKAIAQVDTNANHWSKVIGLGGQATEHLLKSEPAQDNVRPLQEKVSELSCLCEDKEKKIAELQSDLERLSKAMSDLQSKHDQLKLQLKDFEKQHEKVVSTYRTHLLHAAQGFMDEEVHRSLLRIRKIQDSMIC